MKEWRYLVFLVKYHLNRWMREKKQGGVFYIGGSDVFPPPLKPEEELVLLEQLGGEEDVTVKSVLIERNLRLVVYIARKFENTGINVEDLISIGTIGLIKAISTFNSERSARLSTYAARCIDNELLMMLRARKKCSREVSLYEPIGTDREGNEIQLFDVIEMGEEDVHHRLEKKEDVIRFGERVLALPMEQETTMFDLCLGMAVLYFKEKKCDFVVLETGLGGAKDSTAGLSVVPEVCAFTNI